MKDLKKLMRNAINISTKKSKSIKIGQSKLGGKPHLPKNFEWPFVKDINLEGEEQNRPLSFLAQIDLEEAKKYDLDNLLPKSGFLYFFYDLDAMPWGYDPKEKGFAKVVFLDVPRNELCVTNFPKDLDKEYYVPEKRISFERENNLPNFDEYSETFDKTADVDDFEAELEKTGVCQEKEPSECFKLLGYADLIQGSILKECEMVSRNIYCGGSVELDEKTSKDIEQKASDWILLAQFGSFSDDVMFGDCGCLYFYIRKQDLIDLKFENAHYSLQCG